MAISVALNINWKAFVTQHLLKRLSHNIYYSLIALNVGLLLLFLWKLRVNTVFQVRNLSFYLEKEVHDIIDVVPERDLS